MSITFQSSLHITFTIVSSLLGLILMTFDMNLWGQRSTK